MLSHPTHVNTYLLVGAFAVHEKNKSFLKILSGGEYRKCWFLEEWDLIFTFQNLIGLSLLFLSRHAMLLYSIVWLDKKGCEGDLGFEKRESSFEDLVETVNLRYRNYW